jgi:hypothetical protein
VPNADDGDCFNKDITVLTIPKQSYVNTTNPITCTGSGFFDSMDEVHEPIKVY